MLGTAAAGWTTGEVKIQFIPGKGELGMDFFRMTIEVLEGLLASAESGTGAGHLERRRLVPDTLHHGSNRLKEMEWRVLCYLPRADRASPSLYARWSLT